MKQCGTQYKENIGGFQRVFGTKNFIIVDNNEDISDGDLFAECTKRIRGLVKGKVTKPQAKRWIANELSKKRRYHLCDSKLDSKKSLKNTPQKMF